MVTVAPNGSSPTITSFSECMVHFLISDAYSDVHRDGLYSEDFP
jgi:hypothetical protein